MGPVGCLFTMISIGASLAMAGMVLWFLTYDHPGLGFLLFILIVLVGVIAGRKAGADLKSGDLRPEDYFDDDW